MSSQEKVDILLDINTDLSLNNVATTEATGKVVKKAVERVERMLQPTTLPSEGQPLDSANGANDYHNSQVLDLMSCRSSFASMDQLLSIVHKELENPIKSGATFEDLIDLHRKRL